MEEIINEFNDNKANDIRFNQDYSLMSIGTESGYRIYRTYPISDIHEKILFGGISICEISYKSNYLALVGGGTIPKYIDKKVVIYNDEQDCIESEYKFTTRVLNVKFKKNYLFIVCEKKIFVFNTENSQNIDSFETKKNNKGIIAVNGSPNLTIMAHPIEFNDQPDKGYVGIKNYKTNKYFPLLVHEEPISFMEMDYYGLLLATANDKGNIIRIHSCEDKTLLYECKRGKEKAIINFISFDIAYKYMGVSSNRGTIHIWKLNDIIERNKDNNNNEDKKENDNKKNISSNGSENNIKLNNKKSKDKYKVKEIKNYKSESSFAKIRINKPECIFAFKNDDIVIIVTPDEKICYSKIDKKGGNCVVTGEKSLRK